MSIIALPHPHAPTNPCQLGRNERDSQWPSDHVGVPSSMVEYVDDRSWDRLVNNVKDNPNFGQ
jgi:hypothetical protein